jgi:hypothetical protein
MNPYEMMTAEQWELRKSWAERREEKDNQSAIRLANLAMWAALCICDGGE